MKTMKAVITAGLAVALLAGCVQNVKEGASQGIHVDDDMVKPRMNSVAILDRELQVTYVNENTMNGSKEYGHASKIAVENSGARRSPTGTVEVWTLLRNRTNYTQQLECSVQFFDRGGVPVDGPTAWQRVVLSPNQVVPFKELSASADAVNYIIQVREGR